MKPLLVVLMICLMLFAALEGGARLVLGLGTPPLSMEHPTIDYMFLPNQDVYRFGNRQLYNSYGMRSPPLDEQGDRQLILVFGDSVLNGGNLTDHEELATTIATNQSVQFGNVSAGSWGPGNYRAWLDEFGLLGARSVVFVFSNHDLNDQPEFLPLDPNTHPTHRPLFALTELIFRYLPRYVPLSVSALIESGASPRLNSSRPTQRTGTKDILSMFTYFASKSVAVCILFHPTQAELRGGSRKGTDSLQKLADTWRVPTIDLASAYLNFPETDQLYRPSDDIHISARGQRILAEELIQCSEMSRVPTRPYE